MTDMSPHHFDAHPRRSIGDAAVYYTVFSILFVFSLGVFSVLRVAGHRASGGVIQASKHAANGPAGYAVKF